jgi:hypothetical protein
MVINRQNCLSGNGRNGAGNSDANSYTSPMEIEL